MRSLWEHMRAPLFTVLFIFLGLILYTKFFGPIPFSVNSVTTTKTDLFTVQGTGKATTVPDTARVSLGITKTSSSVQTAQDQVNSVMNTIVSELKQLGIPDKDIATTNYSVNPNYDYATGENVIKGYTVTQNVDVKIKPIEKANKALDIATRNGANLVGGITFVLNDQAQKDLENKARLDAIKNAKEKAESIAQAAGIHLGRIINIQENNGYQPPMLMRANADVKVGAPEAANPTELSPGENSVQLDVTISYETY